MNEGDIRQVTVISGKGGTGKSTIIASIAACLKDKAILADADVDAADLYLLFEPEQSEGFDFYGLRKAKINQELCTECGICLETCRFEAISKDFEVIQTRCEGCAACHHLCPISPGEESSGLLVAEVRKVAKQTAENQNRDLVLIDGSPGIGCPVISSLVGVDMAIIVTEPTLSGYHDLDRILQLLEQFKIPGYIVINRYNINEEIAQKIESDFENTFPIVTKIPYNPIFVQAMIEKKSVLEVETEDKDVLQIKKMIIELSNFILKKLKLDD